MAYYLGRRFAAFFLDVVVAGLIGTPPLILVDVLAPGLSDIAFNLVSQVLGFTIFVVYSALTTMTRGQTVGKSLLHLQIVSATSGRRPVDSQVLIRFLALGSSLAVPIVLLPLLQIPPAVVWAVLTALAAPVAVRPDRRALHDLVAGTTVVAAPAGEQVSDSRPPNTRS